MMLCVEQCSRRAVARGRCLMHYKCWAKAHPELIRRGRTGEHEYLAAHYNVRKAKGSASNYSCTGCGGAATDWTFDQPTGFSMDPDRYEPMCRPCHYRKDHG